MVQLSVSPRVEFSYSSQCKPRGTGKREEAVEPVLILGDRWWDLTSWPLRTVNWNKWAAQFSPVLERNKHLTNYSVLKHLGPSPGINCLSFQKKYIVFLEVFFASRMKRCSECPT